MCCTAAREAEMLHKEKRLVDYTHHFHSKPQIQTHSDKDVYNQGLTAVELVIGKTIICGCVLYKHFLLVYALKLSCLLFIYPG